MVFWFWLFLIRFFGSERKRLSLQGLVIFCCLDTQSICRHVFPTSNLVGISSNWNPKPFSLLSGQGKTESNFIFSTYSIFFCKIQVYAMSENWDARGGENRLYSLCLLYNKNRCTFEKLSPSFSLTRKELLGTQV